MHAEAGGLAGVWGAFDTMRRDLIYRGYCGVCHQYMRWQEPTGNRVDRLLCPGCGRMVDAYKASQYNLKGETVCEARTFVETKKDR